MSKTPQPYDWFPPASCDNITEKLNAIPPGHRRIECYRDEKGALLIQVRWAPDADGTAAPTTTAKPYTDPPPDDDSVICPPFCRR